MISAIYDRRSIRKFLTTPISEEDITDIIQSGMKAPCCPQSKQHICNIQSISASIQNMREWLNEDGQLIAAVAFGYPNEFPKERPRRKMEDVVAWRR